MKLSPAQTKALTEIHELGYTNARPNTINSVAKYTTSDGGSKLLLNEEGYKALGLEWQGAPSVVEEIMEELDTNMWGSPETDGDVEDFRNIIEKNKLMGQWKNSEVWESLSLQEIKEDIKTAHPINRAARRLHTKALTSEFRKVFCPRPRKALKITGKVGV